MNDPAAILCVDPCPAGPQPSSRALADEMLRNSLKRILLYVLKCLPKLGLICTPLALSQSLKGQHLLSAVGRNLNFRAHRRRAQGTRAKGSPAPKRRTHVNMFRMQSCRIRAYSHHIATCIHGRGGNVGTNRMGKVPRGTSTRVDG